MNGDYTHFRFDPLKDFSTVLMQQGRVQLDSDWNELMEILDRRWRSETIDIVGECVVPTTTPHGFEIHRVDGELMIGPGRLYLHGLQVEHHGNAEAHSFDAVLAEMRVKHETLSDDQWKDEEWRTFATAIDKQPYYGAGDESMPQDGLHLVYLDAWQREVGYLADEELIEPAIGVDTTTRVQTAWRVRLLQVPDGTRCSTPPEKIEAWQNLVRPSSGRLTSDLLHADEPDDPCDPLARGGYAGFDNSLYRVEVHDDGPLGTATFKWARNNATVATRVIAVSGAELTVEMTKRDEQLRFQATDWIELVDDRLELAGSAGLMCKVKHVDDSTRVITLEEEPQLGGFDFTDLTHNMRIRRWDQKGSVLDDSDAVIGDVDTEGGVIRTGTATVVLEHGITVELSLPDEGGEFHTGDYWVFAARTIDRSIEMLDRVPPRGIHHHYGWLALWDAGSRKQPTDCRTMWPPPHEAGEACECRICVTPESHRSGAMTVQKAVDRVAERGGAVCVLPGVYDLGDSSIIMSNAVSLTLRGAGWKSMFLYSGGGPAIRMEGCFDCSISDISVLTWPGKQGESSVLAMRNCGFIQLERSLCLQVTLEASRLPAIALSGILIEPRIRDNTIMAPIGVGNIGMQSWDVKAMRTHREALPGQRLILAGIGITGNQFITSRVGIAFAGVCVHLLETLVEKNVVMGCEDLGIAMLGQALPDASVMLRGNVVDVKGTGIAVGSDNTQVIENQLTGAGKTSDEKRQGSRFGIYLHDTPLNADGIDRCHIIGNDIKKFTIAGIGINAKVRSAMIKQNTIEASGGGIVMGGRAEAQHLSIENNQLLDLWPMFVRERGSVHGIAVMNTHRLLIGANAIRDVHPGDSSSYTCVGIRVLNSRTSTITANEMYGIGRRKGVGSLAVAIECAGAFESIGISGNTIRTYPSAGRRSSQEVAILVGKTQMDMPDEMTMYKSYEAEERILVLTEKNVRIEQRGRQKLIVQGNTLEGSGRVPAVIIAAAGEVIFSNNHVNRPVRIFAASRKQVVFKELGTASRTRDISETLDVAACVVLGNIVSGGIQVNNNPLHPPWSSLNIIVS